jgi:asparagine synthase (glutamine-hydrolysing)
MFQEASKLPAASILEWRAGRTSQRSYWSLPTADESSKVTFLEAVEESGRLLVEAVRLRLYADVPIGELLSGGVDSALVRWVMVKLNADVRAFTVAPGDPADENSEAAGTAGILGLPHHLDLAPEAAPGSYTRRECLPPTNLPPGL